MLHIPLFLHSIEEQHEKHLYNQSSHYGKSGMFDHQSAHPSYQSKYWVCRSIMLYHYALF